MLTKNDLSMISNLLDKKLDIKLKPIKDDIKQIRRDQKTIATFFDREYLELRTRVEKIEEYLKLNSN